MKDHIEQTKDPSHKSHHNPRSRMLYFWHMLLVLHCFKTLSLSVKVQYSNWMLLAVRGDVEVENIASFCWQERIGVMSSTSKLLCLWFNHSISPTWHLLMLIASSLHRFCARRPQSRRRFLRPACNSDPLRSDAWPLKASTAQSAWRSCEKFRLVVGRKEICYPLLVCSFRQALATCCHQNVTLITLHAQLWTDSRNASNIQSRSWMYSETKQGTLSRSMRQLRTSEGIHGVIYPLLPSLHHFLQATIRTAGWYWLLAVWVQFQFRAENIMKEYEGSIYASCFHSTIHTK